MVYGRNHVTPTFGDIQPLVRKQTFSIPVQRSPIVKYIQIVSISIATIKQS